MDFPAKNKQRANNTILRIIDLQKAAMLKRLLIIEIKKV